MPISQPRRPQTRQLTGRSVAMLSRENGDQSVTVERVNERRVARRRARLALSTSSADIIIHNLSSRGLLMETSTDFRVNDVIKIDLPDAGGTQARVVWRRDGYFGCEFIHPISAAALSATILRSDPIAATYLEEHEAQPNNLSPTTKSSILVALIAASWGAVGLASWALFS